MFDALDVFHALIPHKNESLCKFSIVKVMVKSGEKLLRTFGKEKLQWIPRYPRYNILFTDLKVQYE